MRYELFGTCAVCGGVKSKFLNADEVRLLPPEALAAPAGTTFDNALERDGGVLPLLPLLGAIAAGVSALAGVGSTTANVVLNAKKHAEEERHNREIEKIAREVPAEKVSVGLSTESEASTINGAIGLLRSKGYAVTAPDDMLAASIGYLQGKGFIVSI